MRETGNTPVVPAIWYMEVTFLQDKIKLCIESKHCDDVPDLIVRIHRPKAVKETDVGFVMNREKHFDINFANILRTEIVG